MQIPPFVQALDLVSWPHAHGLSTLALGQQKLAAISRANTSSRSQSTFFLSLRISNIQFSHIFFQFWCLKCFIQCWLVFFNKRISLKIQSVLCPGICLHGSTHRSLFLHHCHTLNCIHRKDHDPSISRSSSLFAVLVLLGLPLGTSGAVGHSFPSFLSFLASYSVCLLSLLPLNFCRWQLSASLLSIGVPQCSVLGIFIPTLQTVPGQS